MSHFKKLIEKYPSYESIDLWFGQKIRDSDARNLPVIFMTAILISRLTRKGDICLDLRDYAGKSDIGYAEDNHNPFFFPDIKKWVEILDHSPCVGKPEEYKPLILHKKRLYMYRFWLYQKKIAEYIKSKTREPFLKYDINTVKPVFSEIFDINDPLSYPIILATVSALLKNFIIITGGPGTGKTTAIAKILTMLIDIESRKQPARTLKIALAAPTGKAAARLKEAIAKVKTYINYDKKILNIIPETSYTIHRLLKPARDFSEYMRNADNPLNFDIIVIDESSMIDIKLMASFIDALNSETKLIILGDKNQLASVDPGSVLADICGDNKAEIFSENFITHVRKITKIDRNRLKNLEIRDQAYDNIIEFKTDFRFHKKSGIKKLSHLINRQNAQGALEYLKKSGEKNIEFINVTDPASLHSELKKRVSIHYKNYLTSEKPEDSLPLFNRFKILCAVRKGNYGISTLNPAIEKILDAEGFINSQENWYHKKPLLITKNNYELNLFNGDIGIVFKTDEKMPYALFSDNQDQIRKIACSMLTYYQTAYAMTVHKSQGSEFEHIVLVLPDHKYPILTKELIYTAVTRAKKSVTILGTEEIFLYSISRRAERASGLKEELE